MSADAGFDTDGVERMFGDLRRTLESMRADRPVAEDAELRGEGESESGQVRVTVVGPSRVESVRLDPRAMRMDSQTLGEEIVTALNAAFADLRAKAVTATPDTAPVDTAALASQLRELQDQSVRRMAQFGQAMNQVLAQLQQRRS
jgi:DNA-binding protein YbaB